MTATADPLHQTDLDHIRGIGDMNFDQSKIISE